MPLPRRLSTPGAVLHPFASGALLLAGALLGCSAAAPAGPSAAATTTASSPAALASSPAPLGVAAGTPSAATPRPAGKMSCAPDRIIDLGTRQLCVEPDPLPWASAKARCESKKGRLASINSAEENGVIFQAFSSPLGHFDSYWVGLSLDDYNVWQWVGGPSLADTNWATGEPNNTNNDEWCAMGYGESTEWNDAPCHNPMAFFCQISPATAKPGKGGFLPVRCAGALVKVDGAEFCYHAEALSWEEARGACASSHGSLLSLPTRAQQDAFRQAIWPRMHLERFWMGSTDAGHEGEWRTTTGATNPFTNWREGEPNNAGGNENCAEWMSSDGRWNDSLCTNKRPSVCESSD